jgi:hypothetical protein
MLVIKLVVGLMIALSFYLFARSCVTAGSIYRFKSTELRPNHGFVTGPALLLAYLCDCRASGLFLNVPRRSYEYTPVAGDHMLAQIELTPGSFLHEDSTGRSMRCPRLSPQLSHVSLTLQQSTCR